MGLLVAIEGIDGSGKGTQAARLLEALKSRGTKATLFSFPRYQQTQFGQKIGDFLNGRFGNLDQVSPFLVSLLFAGDRLESRQLLEQALSTHDVVLCDRYTASNIGHQAAKVDGPHRDELIQWVQFVERDLYQLPSADVTLFLDVPVEHAAQLIALKAKRSYTDQAADLQEADHGYLARVHDVYTQLAESQPGWLRIECVTDGKLKSVDEITAEVFDIVENILESRKPGKVTFEELAASRRAWISDVLKEWCRTAPLAALKQAELEWTDIAGKVAPEKTLWPWAWSRFPDLVHESLGIDETCEVEVVLDDGRTLQGFPDSRASQKGSLVILGSSPEDNEPSELGPFSIERIASVRQIASGN